MSKVLITGGAGFIGSYVAKSLIGKGLEVALYDAFVSYVYPLDKVYIYHINKRMEWLGDKVRLIRGNTIDQSFLRRSVREYNPDYIVHLAAMPLANLAMDRPEEAARSIFTGTMNLLETACDLKNLKRLVYVSSSMVYGDFVRTPAAEDHPTDPKEIYGAMKLSGELATRAFGRLYHLDYSIVRPSAVYGMTDNNRRVLSIFLENALAGKPVVIRGADQTLDFSFVGDVAEGITAVALHPDASGQTFNITRGRGRSLLEVARIIEKAVPGLQIEIKEADSKLPVRGCLDITKARTLVGYNPRVDIEEGIVSYLDFIRRRREEIGQ